jgi:hypothetical protein
MLMLENVLAATRKFILFSCSQFRFFFSFESSFLPIFVKI